MKTEKDIQQFQILAVFNDNTGKAVGLSPIAAAAMVKALGIRINKENGKMEMYNDKELQERNE